MKPTEPTTAADNVSALRAAREELRLHDARITTADADLKELRKLHPEPEPVFKCPRCHAVRPRSEWGSRYGIATCQGCLSKGYVILPETLHGEQPREGEVPGGN